MQDDKQATRATDTLPQGGEPRPSRETNSTGRRPPRKRKGVGHLSDAAWEGQSPDPRDKRE